jgi:hypothetical protein
MVDFASRYISEVESSKGFVGGAGRAATGTMKDIGKTFSKENLVRSFFGGNDIISAAIRSQFGVKKKPTKEKPATQPERIDSGKTGGGAVIDVTTIKIIAKNSMSLPGIARDMNVLRQNLQKLVKIWGDKDTKAATGADAQFLKEGEREKKVEVESEAERAKDIEFFKTEDAREAAMEDRGGDQKATVISGEKPSDKKEGGFLGSFIPNFAKNFIAGFKKLFVGGKLTKILGKVFTKIFLPLTIVATLFSGITAGFKKYQETGSFKDAIVAGLGGMLNFITFGLVGEKELKNVFDSVSSFLDPIMDKISEIFTGIKNFFIKLFGGKVDVKDDTPAKVEKPKPQMPDTKEFLPNKEQAKAEMMSVVRGEPTKEVGVMRAGEPTKEVGVMRAGEPTKEIGEKDITAMAERAGVPKGAMGDLKGIVESGKTGGFEAMFAKAREFEQKYPAPPPTPESPVPLTAEGIPLDQAQRNFELNTALTGRASAALGVPLELPAPPTPAASPSPMSEPPPPTPSPTPALSKEEKIKQLEENIENNKKRFARREENAKRHIESFSRRYANDPDRVKELKNDYEATLKTEKVEMESANESYRKEIDTLKKMPDDGSVSSPGTTPSPATSAPAPGPAGGAPAATPSGGGGGGASVSAAATESAPAPITAEPPTSGSSLSTASSEIAEAQRMESAAEVGSMVNAPVTNNSTGTTGQQPKKQTANVFNEELANLLGGIRI